jgi:hypothetical protein
MAVEFTVCVTIWNNGEATFDPSMILTSFAFVWTRFLSLLQWKLRSLSFVFITNSMGSRCRNESSSISFQQVDDKRNSLLPIVIWSWAARSCVFTSMITMRKCNEITFSMMVISYLTVKVLKIPRRWYKICRQKRQQTKILVFYNAKTQEVTRLLSFSFFSFLFLVLIDSFPFLNDAIVRFRC